MTLFENNNTTYEIHDEKKKVVFIFTFIFGKKSLQFIHRCL